MIHSELWNSVKQELKSQFPDHAYSTWFDPIQSIGLDNDELVLEVPNQFFFEWIKSHYHEAIKKIARDSMQKSVEIKYTVCIAKANDLKEQIEETTKHSIIPPRKNNNQLNYKYTFSTFIEGDNNRFAKAAASGVGENPGQISFNPLVIYGGVGMGKTHLLHAIGNRINQEKPELKVICASSEKFTLDFISSIQKNKTVEFSKFYRKSDVLLIDDIQFFQGKEQTQEQFFHTFNELFHAGKQIVMTADKYPGEMVGLQDRLLSRFQSGLSVDIQPANFETRIAILMEKAEQNNLSLPYEIIELIAKHVKNNVRELESTIIRLLAHSSLLNTEINYELAKKVVKDSLGKRTLAEITVEDIIKRVSEITHIKEKDIVGASRKMQIAEARQISIFLCRELLTESLVNIGLHFGGRDHSTVLHACRVVETKSKNNFRIKSMVGDLREELSFAQG